MSTTKSIKISSNYGPHPIIVLTLSQQFINKYNLYHVLNGSSIYENFLLGKKQNKPFKYPFLFPPDKSNYPANYLKGFLNLYNNLIDQYDLTGHGSEILFLSNIYAQADKSENKRLSKEQVLRKRGKLLYNLIKSPLPQYTLDNIYEAYADEELSNYEVDEILKTYLIIITGHNKGYFETDSNSLNYSVITKEFKKQLIEKVLAETNICVHMENGRDLIISKDVRLSLSSLGKYYEANAPYQNLQLCSIIAKHLYQEQMEAKTQFHQELLKFDYALETDYDKLGIHVSDWHKTSHNTYNQYRTYHFLLKYLVDNSLIKANTKEITARKRNDFIYQYFILLSFFPKNRKIDSRTTVKQIVGKLHEFKQKQKDNPRFATIKFSDSFKNLSHIEESNFTF